MEDKFLKNELNATGRALEDRQSTRVICATRHRCRAVATRASAALPYPFYRYLKNSLQNNKISDNNGVDYQRALPILCNCINAIVNFALIHVSIHRNSGCPCKQRPFPGRERSPANKGLFLSRGAALPPRAVSVTTATRIAAGVSRRSISLEISAYAPATPAICLPRRLRLVCT
jgi:hypothetical protein